MHREVELAVANPCGGQAARENPMLVDRSNRLSSALELLHWEELRCVGCLLVDNLLCRSRTSLIERGLKPCSW